MNYIEISNSGDIYIAYSVSNGIELNFIKYNSRKIFVKSLLALPNSSIFIKNITENEIMIVYAKEKSKMNFSIMDKSTLEEHWNESFTYNSSYMQEEQYAPKEVDDDHIFTKRYAGEILKLNVADLDFYIADIKFDSNKNIILNMGWSYQYYLKNSVSVTTVRYYLPAIFCLDSTLKCNWKYKVREGKLEGTIDIKFDKNNNVYFYPRYRNNDLTNTKKVTVTKTGKITETNLSTDNIELVSKCIYQDKTYFLGYNFNKKGYFFTEIK